ncbi:MAG: DUF6240 domain-containing protein [Lachnospiraceae bacterium]|nr:DUF6240 domain-containing protein [Lachnospiraceae bacterium]
MRITFNESYINQTDLNTKAAAKEESLKKVGGQSAFTVEHAEKKREGLTYTQQGMTKDDVQKSLAGKNVQQTKNYMAVMSGCMSDADFAKLQEEGYQPGNTPVDVAVTVVDEIKAKMIEAGVNIPGYTDTIDKETLTKITGSENLANEMIKSAEETGVVLTVPIAQEATAAIKMAQEIEPLSDATKDMMIEKGQQPTIENLYFAQHSSMPIDMEPSMQIDPADMKAQIDEIIDRTGIIKDEETIKAAEDLVRKEIPLTEETMQTKLALNEIKLPMDEALIIKSVMVAIADGKQAKDAILGKTETAWQQAAEVYAVVQELTPEAADLTAEEHSTLSVARMSEAQQAIDCGEKMPSRQNIHARRVLEEVRLQMTIQANRVLLKSGYKIETTEMEKLVDLLVEADREQSAVLYDAQDESVITERKEQLIRTAEILHFIPHMPIETVKDLADANGEMTLPAIREEGENRLRVLREANTQYETFMTTPRADLGDSIKTAFRNAQDLLIEMGMEPTEENCRAVRILGYNRMEISEDSIAVVTEADSLLRSTIEKMTPAATLGLIRDGKNPLEMTVMQLHNELSDRENDREKDAEKYSKFLYKLEHKGEITPEEKESYIGIYRLLRQIEKSDGAVIGSLVNQGAELTVDNLLSALRSRKARGIDWRIDDQNGGIKEVTFRGTSIDSQIKTAFDAQHFQATAEEYERLRNFDEYEKERVAIYREYSSDASVEKILEEMEMPVTAENILAASEYLADGGVLGRRIRRFTGSEDLKENLHLLDESMIGEEEALQAYQDFAKKETAALEKVMEADHTLTSDDIRQLAYCYKQLSFAAKRAESREYDIPVMTENSCVALHLTIKHSDINNGRVDGFMETESLGKCSFKLLAGEDGVTGLLIASKEEGSEKLEAIGESITTKLSQLNLAVKEMQTGINTELTIRRTDTTSTDAASVSTVQLYKAAKALVTAIRENAERD